MFWYVRTTDKAFIRADDKIWRTDENMNIQEAKKKRSQYPGAYLHKDAMGSYTFPLVRQRPILLIGPPGIGKTAVMEQIARECQVGLVSYTMTHHHTAECD